MFGGWVHVARSPKDEAEKPFWISFADLMTALMVLFLLVMSVALLAVTKTVNEEEIKRAERLSAIENLLDQIVKATDRYPGVTVDKSRSTIDFGDKARFDYARNQLTDNQAKLLREFVPDVLAIARSDLGKKWLKRIVVEGFTDQSGTYLYNLNLSLQRSQRVLCVLLADPLPGEKPMTDDERERIRELFLVGGYSFNSLKSSPEASRRIELRLEFFGIEEVHPSTDAIPRGDFGRCALE
jgi:outer membrane protein OmpA-like peptidoglycan-associated protein